MKSVLKAALQKAGRGLLVVVHDPKVDRAAKQLGVLALVRLLLVFGAAPEVVLIVQKALS